MKKALALILVLALLFSLLVGTRVVKLGMANPGLWLLGFPRDPVQTSPELIFQSPINNQTYDFPSVWLNFTIVKPESWFFVANPDYISPNNYIYVNITSISYTIDGITSETIPISDVTDLLVEYSPSRSLNFSTNLTLPEGAHNLTVSLQCDSYYWGSHHYLPDSIQMNFSSEVVDFTITSGSSPTTLIIAASGASVAIIGIGLLVYFKKRKH